MYVNWNKLNQKLTGIGGEFHAASKRSKSEKSERRGIVSALKEVAALLNTEYYSGDLNFYAMGEARSFRTYHSNIAGAVLNKKRFGDLFIVAEDFYRIAQSFAVEKPAFAERICVILGQVPSCSANIVLEQISVADGLLPSRHRGRPRSACIPS